MPTCDQVVDCEFCNGGWNCRNNTKFDKFPNPQSVLECVKVETKIKRLPVLIFHRILCYRLKSSRSVKVFKILDARIAYVLKMIIQNFGNFADVRFYPMFNFGHFWAASLVTLLIFRNVMTLEHLNEHLNTKTHKHMNTPKPPEHLNN